MPSIKQNFLYSSILTASNYIFPLLSYPYVSRVLGVTNIGICNYVDSIIHYFILFSMMGIAATGIREIAAHKDDKERLSSVFTNLIILNGLFTLGALIILIVSMFTIPQLSEYRSLFWIGVMKLLGNVLLFEWLFKGVEDFKFITKRTIIIKTIYVICVFVFVKDKDDYTLYFLLTTLMVVVNALVNCIYSRHFVRLSFKYIDFSPLIKSYVVIGFYLILNSFYTSFNVAFLGFISTPKDVGYYTTATKLFSIIIAIFSAFTGVMLPRMSSLRAEGKMIEFNNMIYKSIGILLAFSIPTIVFSIFFVPNIINLFAGKGYEGAYLPARIVMPLIFIIGYEQILVLQVLLPMKKDKATFINSVIGASIGIVANILLVPSFRAIGSSLVWFCSEVTVLCCAQYWTSRYVKFYFPWSLLFKYIVSYAPLFLICLLMHTFQMDTMICFLTSGVITVIYTFLVQMFILKNEVFVSLCHKIQIRIKI